MTIEKNDLPTLLRQLRLRAMSELCERLHDEAIEKGWTPEGHFHNSVKAASQ